MNSIPSRFKTTPAFENLKAHVRAGTFPSNEVPLVMGGQGRTSRESLRSAEALVRCIAGFLSGLNAAGAIVATYRQEPACTAIFALASVGAFIVLVMMPESADAPSEWCECPPATHIDEVA